MSDCRKAHVKTKLMLAKSLRWAPELVEEVHAASPSASANGTTSPPNQNPWVASVAMAAMFGAKEETSRMIAVELSQHDLQHIGAT